MFSIEMAVRDYELDALGIVHHSRYLQYFEHARNQFLLTLGESFPKLAADGHQLVVSALQVRYISPLCTEDRFVIQTVPRLEGRVRMVFDQVLTKAGQTTPAATAAVTVIAIKPNGRPYLPDFFSRFLSKESKS